MKWRRLKKALKKRALGKRLTPKERRAVALWERRMLGVWARFPEVLRKAEQDIRNTLHSVAESWQKSGRNLAESWQNKAG